MFIRFLSAVLLLQLTLAPGVAAKEPSAADLQRLVDSLRTLQQELSERQGARSALAKKLRHTETEMGSLHGQINAIEKNIVSGRERQKSLRRQQLELRKQLHAEEASFDKQLQAAYLLHRENRLKLLLDQDNPQRLARLLAYYDYLTRDNRQQVDAFMRDLRELVTVSEALQDANARLEHDRQQLVERRDRLDTLQGSRRQTMAKLDTEIGTSQRRIAETERQRKELEDLLESMSRALADIELDGDIPAFNAARGKMPWPAGGSLRNSFGGGRGQGSLRWHGVMIGAKEGSEVRAIHHGRVVYADWLRGSGLLIILDHGDGYMSLYAHNQQLMRETGEWVNTGDTLANVGTTGGQQRAGLYFEIRHRGQPLDPVSWCRRRT